MYEYESVHKCSLRSRDTKPAVPPLSPGVGIFQRWLSSIRKLLILNERDMRSKNFFKTSSAMKNEKRRHIQSKYWYIIHPFSKLNQYIEVIFLVTMLHRWMFVMNTLSKSYRFKITCFIRDIFHVIIMVSFFITGYVKYSAKEIFIHPKETVKHYLLTFFILDLFMLLGQESFLLILEMMNLMSDDYPIERIVAPFTLVSLFIHIIRAKSLVHVICNLAMNAGFGKTFIFLLEQFTTLLIILHFYTSMFFAIPYNLYIRNNHVPVDSWISIRNLTITEYRLDTYFEGSMIVLSYFFGSYYHDPIKLPIEQLLLFFFTFTGRSFVLVIIGRMLSNFGFSDRADTEYENILIQVNSYMRSYQVPIEIQEQIIERFEYTYQKKYFNVQQMMTILTDHLKTELFLFGAKNLISNNPFLKSLKPNELALLFSHMKSMIFSKHEVILSGFQAQNNIYFILSGTVAGYSEGVEVFHAKDGDVFGIATLYTPLELANYWYVVAIETTEVYFINKKRMYTFMQDRPDVTKYFLEIFTERLNKLEQRIRQKYEGGEDIRELLKKGILLEKLKNRENIVLDMEIR